MATIREIEIETVDKPIEVASLADAIELVLKRLQAADDRVKRSHMSYRCVLIVEADIDDARDETFLIEF